MNRLYREGLAMRRRLLGAEHPEVAMSLANLGCVLLDLGRYDEAERLIQQLLAEKER